MPTFHFHTVDAAKHRDDDGSQFADLMAARRAAVKYAGELIKSEPDLACTDQGLRVVVIDESDQPLFAVVAHISPAPDADNVR